MKYDINSIKKRKKINHRIKKIIFIFMIIMIYNVVLFYMSYIDKSKNTTFYSYKSFGITTESMEPLLKVDDAIITKKVKQEELKKGDIITYNTDVDTITHRIVNIEEDNDNQENTKYFTKGDSNVKEDEGFITFEQIEGKYLFKIPYFAKVINSLKNGIVIILGILIFLVIYLNRIDMKEKSESRRAKKKFEDKKFLEKE